MKRFLFLILSGIIFPASLFAATVKVDFTEPPAGAETWVFVGTKDCGVVNGVMVDKSICPYGQIGPQGATSVEISNVPPNVTVYATAKHVYRATGEESSYAPLFSSATPTPPLPISTEPIPFPPPVIIQWPGGDMTITHQGNQ